MISKILILIALQLLSGCLFASGSFFKNVIKQKQGQDSKSPASPAPILLAPCKLPEIGALPKEARCGTFEVFEDRVANTGRKISLRIVILSATAQERADDPLFFISGGPGGSAVEEAPTILRQFSKLRAHRDFVFTDQRGTGGSNPLNCDFFDPSDLRSYTGDYFPLKDVRKCRDQLEQKANLKLYTTPIAMDDLEDVRVALGYDQINIVGTSYGSRAVQVYLKRHPKHVRTVVLRGVSTTNQFMPRDFPQHTERALNGIMAECAADNFCRNAFPNLRAEARSVLRRLLRGPVEVELRSQNAGAKTVRVSLSRDLAAEAIRYMLYQPQAASRIPLFIHLAANGNFTPLAEAAIFYRRGLVASGSNGMYLSVTCAEDLPMITADERERNVEETFLGDYRLRQQRAACALWRQGTIPEEYAEPTISDVPTLIVSGQWDPVTPPMYGESTAKYLSHSLHIIVPHGGHGVTGLTGVECLEDLVATFINRGTATGLDTSCINSMVRKGFTLRMSDTN